MPVKHLGKEISALRARQGLSLRRAAKIVGFSYQAVLNAEHGNTSFESALRIAKGLGTAPERLIELAVADATDLAKSIC